MLRAREEGGYKFLPFLRMNLKGYSAIALYFGAILVVTASIKAWPVFIITLGMFFGVLLRDVSWLVGVNRTWPFVIKVTDWDAVKKLADEK
jgi:hypothetical protein